MPRRGKTAGPASVPPPLHELETAVMEDLWRSGELRHGDVALSHLAQQMASLDPARRRALQRLARKT